MDLKRDLEKQVLMAAQNNNISSVLFRNTIGRKLGLNLTDAWCISFLLLKRISTPTELAHYSSLTTGSTTAMLDRLEQAELITRKPNPKDRRGTIIEVNEKAAEKFAPLVAGVQQAHTELIAEYSDNELKVIADFLTRFTANVDKQTQLIEQDLTA